VPIGGGVSSSAALEVGTALALLALAGQKMDPIPLALLARQAEHRYAHSPCGIMDQFICVLGQAGHALLLDCRNQAYEQVPLPADDAELVVMNTQVKHSIGQSEYPVRQQQCRDGLAGIQQQHPELTSLRDVTTDMLDAAADRMDDVAFRRCRHVVTEIDRTKQAADALRAGDLATFGQLMFASHASLRDDYAVSCDELDALVEIAGNVPGVHGARMTGGGFGGCAIALVRRGAEDKLRAAIESDYNGRFAEPAIVYTTTAAKGAAIEPIR
jgi:galactokinase